MKNKKALIVAVMLVAVLCAGVGFAAVTDTLTVNGGVTVGASADEMNQNFDTQVYFENAKIDGVATTSDGAGNEIGISADKDTVSITCASLKTKDQTVTFTVDVKNAGDLNVSVAPVFSGVTNTDYFEVTHDWGSTAKTVNAGNFEILTITVKLLRTPAEVKSDTFTLTLNATAN